MLHWLIPLIVAICAFLLARKYVKSNIIVQIIIAVVLYFVIWWVLGFFGI